MLDSARRQVKSEGRAQTDTRTSSPLLANKESSRVRCRGRSGRVAATDRVCLRITGDSARPGRWPTCN
ncbi:hypothetical protein J6590_077581 [Homalodisca vitripennis]|nr:hypothetical protein J6590_077581 [Homalodisca vitripennis]